LGPWTPVLARRVNGGAVAVTRKIRRWWRPRVLHRLQPIADSLLASSALPSIIENARRMNDVQMEADMTHRLKAWAAVAGMVVATQAAAQVTFYEHDEFHGRAFVADRPIGNLERLGFNDRASSAVVDRGRWEVCEDAGFHGRCIVLRRGSYPSLAAMGLDKRISSIRPVDEHARYEEAPPPMQEPSYAYRQRPEERLYQVPVSAVHAVVGPPERRCWVERQQVTENHSGANVPGAIIGAVVGGVLGHQIGGGRGQDLATAGGAVAGGVVGAGVGRGGGPETSTRDVQRCQDVQSQAQPDYWDVTYNFRGVQHHAQLSAPPGPTITVNDNGEPRG